MRIDNDIRYNPLGRKRHILMSICNPHSPLLSMSRRKLVSNLRHPRRPHAHLDKLQPLLIRRHHNLINNPRLGTPHRRTHVPLRMKLCPLSQFFGIRWNRRRLANDDIVAGNTCAGGNKSVIFEFIVRAVFETESGPAGGFFEFFHDLHSDFFFCVHVAAVKDGAEEASVDGRLVHDDGVFLVVAAVAEDCDDGVLAGGEVSELEEFHGSGCCEGFLRVVKDIAHGVHSDLIVGQEYTYHQYTKKEIGYPWLVFPSQIGRCFVGTGCDLGRE